MAYHVAYRYLFCALYEARFPRPPGVHSGELDFDAEGIPLDADVRRLWLADAWKTVDARAVAQSVCTGANMRWRLGMMDADDRRVPCGGHTHPGAATSPRRRGTGGL